jgi:hypothetical protein
MADTITKHDETVFSSRETGPDVEKNVDDEPGQVEDKWRGTREDRQDMNILGKKQVLRVSSYLILLFYPFGH